MSQAAARSSSPSTFTLHACPATLKYLVGGIIVRVFRSHGAIIHTNRSLKIISNSASETASVFIHSGLQCAELLGQDLRALRPEHETQRQFSRVEEGREAKEKEGREESTGRVTKACETCFLAQLSWVDTAC